MRKAKLQKDDAKSFMSGEGVFAAVISLGDSVCLPAGYAIVERTFREASFTVKRLQYPACSEDSRRAEACIAGNGTGASSVRALLAVAAVVAAARRPQPGLEEGLGCTNVFPGRFLGLGSASVNTRLC